MPAISSTEEHQPLNLRHQTNNSTPSSPTSIAAVQRAASTGPGRSAPRPLASQQDLQAPKYFHNGSANSSKPVISSEQKRRPSASHSRPNSVNGVRDGIGNLNRWSQSTTSSKGSAANARSNSLSRRMSLGGPGAFTFGGPTTYSQNKLQKPRRPAPESPSGQTPPTHTIENTPNPTASLPPLITLPALQQNSSSRASALTPTTSTPSTAGLLSAAVRSTVPDYFSGSWDDNRPRDYSRSPQRDRSPVESLKAATAYSVKTNLSSSPSGRERHGAEQKHSRGHSRNRSHVGKSSSGTLSSDKSKDRAPKQPSQKAMLSIALQKANTAVLLDNAQNFEGAMQAYSEACNLLQHVMTRSSGDEDKRKLEDIVRKIAKELRNLLADPFLQRNTYTKRIRELEKIAPIITDDGKALPARPESAEFRQDDDQSPIDDDEQVIIGTAMVTRIPHDDSYVSEPQRRQILASQLPKRRESLMPSAFDLPGYKIPLSGQNFQQRTQSRSPMREMAVGESTKLAPPMDREYMPPPLSPRRPLSPADKASRVVDERPPADSDQPLDHSETVPGNGHERSMSVESMSWLDMIDGSGDSTASSVHSRTSSLGVRRKHIRASSGATEAEFDAALDAAVEAAYDEGFEPMEEPNEPPDSRDYDDEIVANVRRRVELAKERVRQTERETAIQLAHDRERIRQLQEDREKHQSLENSYDANESEEEERMLDEMTRGYIMDDFEFGLQSKSALPRESDSSGFSGRTWNSSIGSNPTTAGTSLSTVTETLNLPDMPSLLAKTPSLLHPPPALTLPQLPTANASESSTTTAMQSANNPAAQGVRSRRLSGQNPKQLKIETSTRIPPIPAAPGTLPPSVHIPYSQAASVAMPPPTTGINFQSRQPLPGISGRPPMPQTTRQSSSPFPGPSPSETIPPPTPTMSRVSTKDGESGIAVPRSGSPARAQSRSGLRKNFSSSSLKNMKNRNLSVSNMEDASDASPNTPLNGQFGGPSASKDTTARLPAMPTLPTPIAAAFRDKMNGMPTGGLYLFDGDINSPESPGSPSVQKGGAPIPLEPCPTEFLLRPFWLMRALYQTLAHPRGGYLSTKLFIPRDVWRVKGVKIKSLEDKIANCDYLTAALQKLGQVDTCDADAVLDEMQALENVLEQVQVTLTKKLGNEVGIQGSGVLFRDASATGENESIGSGSKTPGPISKSASFSWRRLRSKNSAVSLANHYSNKSSAVESVKDGINTSTLPMTSLPTIRFAKRDVNQVQFSGPNANYMGSLARLFDAAQVIDQIARQVEDPGLRHADKTQVGLELSTRHAAEFFGFYICRFVLTDISLLLDKFIKRGSEWVLV